MGNLQSNMYFLPCHLKLPHFEVLASSPVSTNTKSFRLAQGSLLFPKMEFFIKAHIRGLSFL